MKTIVNLITALALVAIGVYIMVFIPSAVDFSNVIIRLEDNDTIYRFLVYLPVILTIFNGVLTLSNAFFHNRTLTIMNAVIAIGIAVYVIVDVMGSVTAVASIGTILRYLEYVNIGVAICLIGEFIVDLVLNKKKTNVANNQN